jgi:hypothetical protein
MLFAGPQEEPWKRHQIAPAHHRVHGFRLHDLNRDGRPDIIATLAENREIRVYTHPERAHVRAATAWAQVSIPAICAAEDAFFVDLDSDGAMDILSACPGPRPAALFVQWGPNWEGEQIPAPNPIVQWAIAIPFRVSPDRRDRIVAAGKHEYAELSLFSPGANPRDLTQWTGKLLDVPGWTMSLIPVDMDGDGDEDLLMSDRNGSKNGLFWLEAPNWQRHSIGSANEEVMFLDEADIDGDGLNDISAAIRPDTVVWYRRLDASGLNWKRYSLPYPPGAGTARAVSIGDLNRDGRMDIVVSSEGVAAGKEGIWWLEQAKGGFWKSHRLSGPQGIKFDRIELLDIDGDGDLDLMTAEDRTPLGVIWYENPHQR